VAIRSVPRGSRKTQRFAATLTARRTRAAQHAAGASDRLLVCLRSPQRHRSHRQSPQDGSSGKPHFKSNCATRKGRQKLEAINAILPPALPPLGSGSARPPGRETASLRPCRPSGLMMPAAERVVSSMRSSQIRSCPRSPSSFPVRRPARGPADEAMHGPLGRRAVERISIAPCRGWPTLSRAGGPGLARVRHPVFPGPMPRREARARLRDLRLPAAPVERFPLRKSAAVVAFRASVHCSP